MPDPTDDDAVSAIAALRQPCGRYALIEFLRGQATPAAAVALCRRLQRTLYWTHKDVRGMVAASQVGIQHALNAAAADGADDLLGEAKQLAYDLGANTWPGWGETGVVITPADQAVGREAACLNLRLARHLNRPDKAMVNAIWLVGAHELADGQPVRAAATFRSAEAYVLHTGSMVLTHMLRAYAALADLLADWTNGVAAADLNAEWDALAEDGSDDALEYAGQIRVARNLFGRCSGYEGPQGAPPQP